MLVSLDPYTCTVVYEVKSVTPDYSTSSFNNTEEFFNVLPPLEVVFF